MENEPASQPFQPDERESSRISLGALGMTVFLMSLSVLFAATLIGYLLTRARAETWPPPDAPGLPTGLWYSTLVIVCTSIAIQYALNSIRKGNVASLKIGLVATTLLGIGFLVLQSINWSILIGQHFTVQKNLYAFLFYLLTGLHAAHVIGGIIPLGIVTTKAFRNRYTMAHYPGVRYCAMYWHFLDVVWIVLFAMLLLTS